MRKLPYWLRFFKAFISRFKYILAGGAICGILFFTVIPKITGFLFPFSSGETVGVVGRYTINTLPIHIQNEISSGLTKINPQGELEGALAKTWQSQDDGKSWIFTLGEFNWQDGTQVRARDINYMFSDVTSEIINDQNIKFSLSDAFAPLPTVMTKPVFKKGLLGTGKWKVVKLTQVAGGEFIETLKLLNTDSLQIKTYKFYPTEDTARTSFKLGEVKKLIDIVDPHDLKDWKQNKSLETVRKDLYVAVFINNQDPLLSDKSFRQALAYAINKDSLSSNRAISPISPVSWVYNPQVKPYVYNSARSKELVNTLSKETRENLNLKLVTTPTLLSVADKIKNDWEAIGIKTFVQVSNTPPRDFQTMLAIQEIPIDPDQYSFWHSTQTSSNITNYRNSKESQRIDKLLEDGRRILDSETRKQIYFDFQRFLIEDSPLIILYHPTTFNIERK